MTWILLNKDMRGRAQHKHGGDNSEGSEEDEAESEHESVISNRST